jgi:aminoglycoside phosphotransferase (APT) family kinase protein
MIVTEDHIEPVPGGTINTTFRILQGKEAPLYLRIAPGDTEVEAGPAWMTPHGLRREVAAIGMLEPLAALLPRTVHADWSRQVIDRDWVLQTRVPGTPWSDLAPDLTPAENMDLWRQLGTITSTIHAIVGAEFGPPEEGCGHDSWAGQVRWDVTGLLVDAQRFGVDPDSFERLTALVNESVSVLDRITEPRLIHSDLHPRHVFVGRDSGGGMEVSGLIDLEFARFADPLSESIFVEDGLHPGEDAGFGAFCEAYRCDLPSRDSRLRSYIYQLTALGWTVMDLHRLGQEDRITGILGAMAQVLDEAERMV